MKRNIKAICETCPYWNCLTKNKEMGECRRRSPSEDFPVTMFSDWCGDNPVFQCKDDK